jgi:hypothetical protein
MTCTVIIWPLVGAGVLVTKAVSSKLVELVAEKVTELVPHQVIESLLRVTPVVQVKSEVLTNVPVTVFVGGVIHMPPTLFVILT